MSSRTSPSAAGILACLASVAAAQPGGRDGGLRWTPVEQGVDDRNPLAARLRAQPADLRQPTDFDRVFRLDPSLGRRDATVRLFGGAGLRGEVYARRSGGVTAVFPASSYKRTRGGLLRAEVPAGTVFALGDSVGGLLGADPYPAPPATGANFVDLSAAGDAPPEPRPAAPLTIWSDDRYRRERLRALLR